MQKPALQHNAFLYSFYIGQSSPGTSWPFTVLYLCKILRIAVTVVVVAVAVVVVVVIVVVVIVIGIDLGNVVVVVI